MLDTTRSLAIRVCLFKCGGSPVGFGLALVVAISTRGTPVVREPFGAVVELRSRLLTLGVWSVISLNPELSSWGGREG